MSEALKSVVEYGFHDLKLDYIEAFTHKCNESSKKLLEKNNFKLSKDRKDKNNEENIIYSLEKQIHSKSAV